MNPRPRALLVAALALVLVGGVAWVGWTWRHPHAFRPYPGGVSESFSDAQIGRTEYVGTLGAARTSDSLTIRSARPVVETNTADATVEVLLCTVRAGQEPIGAAGERAARRSCTLSTVAGAVLQPGDVDTRDLVVAITPHRPGRVQVRGIEVSYDSGWQTGTQRIGIDAGLRARRTAGQAH